MAPTLTATLGVKGRRPAVGKRDCKDLLYAFAVVNVVTAALHADLVDSPADAQRKAGRCKTRRLREAFAAHLRHVGRAYPGARHKRVAPVIDNAPWRRGKPVDDALAGHPHLELYRLPGYSPQLNAVERFWRVLRRRATHNRLFDALADLKRSVRNSLRYFQALRRRVALLVTGCYQAKATASANS
jgi:transposase